MSKATRPINIFIDEEWAERLRTQLIMYRFKNLGKPLPEFEFGNFNDARVLELFVSLLQVAPSEKVKDGMRRLADGSIVQRWLCCDCGYRSQTLQKPLKESRRLGLPSEKLESRKRERGSSQTNWKPRYRAVRKFPFIPQ